MRYIFLLLCLLLCFNLKPTVLYATENQEPTESDLSEKNKRKFDYFFLEALKLKQSEKFSDAFNTFQYCLSIDSTSAVTHYELSQFYIYLNNKNLALNALKKAVLYDQERYDYLIALANLSREIGLNDSAIEIYEKLRKKHPDKPELNYYLSDLYVRQKKIEKAIGELDYVEENSGMNESVSIQKYRLYMMIEEEEKAFNELEKLADKYPYEAKYQILIGDLYLEKKETEKAYKAYQKAFSVDPEDPYYIVSMANYYEQTGEQKLAKEEIDNALKNPKLDIETKLTILGKYIQNLQKNKKEIENANSLFETLMEQNPQETELNLMYGTFLLAQEKVEDAKFQFQIVTESSPENIAAWEQLLRISHIEENPQESIEICKNALIHFPEFPLFYFYLGISYYQVDDYQEALKAYQKGIQYIDAKDVKLLSDFYGQIGDIYHQIKNKELAYKNYEIALEHNDKNIGVLNNYAYYLSLDKKELNKAERMSSICVKMYPDNSTYIDTYAWIFFVQGNYTLAKFYIESAISKGGDESKEIVDHYGDILYKVGNKEKALEQWEKALEIGKDTETLKRKIADKTYYEDPDEN